MLRNVQRVAVVVLLLLLPVLVAWMYGRLTAPPNKVVIAGGPENGRYEQLAAALAREIEAKLDIAVQVLPTEGSYENLALLERGEADFILYQHGVVDMFVDRPVVAEAVAANSSPVRDQPAVAFVANLYSEVTHFLVRRGIAVDSPLDLPGLRVAIGREKSGDSAMSRLVLTHFGINVAELAAHRFSYGQIEQAFRDGELDAAFITVGLGAPIIRRLVARGGEEREVLSSLRAIPHADAMAAEYLSVSRVDVPSGLYRARAPIEPSHSLETIGVRAQLLARSDLHAGLIEEVTLILLDESFQQRAGLRELLTRGADFARQQPEFTPHQGAINVYEPGIKPLLDTDFVEATEGMRSFVVSMLIAGWLAARWWRDHSRRQSEHKLDRYVKQVLEIERKQLDYDQSPGGDDADALQKLLDDVTELRQEALKEFTAHEINEDRAFETFIHLCHALSDKINAKLTRQRIDSALRPLAPRAESEQSSD